MKEKIKEIFNNEAIAIKNIPVTDSFEEAIGIIHRQVHGKNGKLVTS